MKIINHQSKASYRKIVSFVAEKGIMIVQKNKNISEWVRTKASDAIERLLYEGDWIDEDDFEVEITILSALRSSGLSMLKTISSAHRFELNSLISFLKI